MGKKTYNLKAEMKGLIDDLKKDKIDPKIAFEFVRSQYKKFLEYREFCARKGYKQLESFSIVPIIESDFNLLQNMHFTRMLLALEVALPVQGQCWLRIKGTYQKIDIDMILDKFEHTLAEFWNDEKKEYCTEQIRFDPKELEEPDLNKE